MSKDDLTIMGCFGLCVYVMIILVGATICRGLATSVLWQWFAIPLFGLPSISIAQAIGIHLVVNSIIAKQATPKTEEKDIWVLCAQAAGAAVVAPLIAIGIGWIVLQFV